MLSSASDQDLEKELRERVATQHYDNYLEAISQSHSIPVMDYEVDRFLASMPQGAVILDIGGCWGWHWRRLAETRPDVSVLIIDFVRANLNHAQKVLGSLVGTQIALMHADATALPFSDISFDGVWTVQVFQHIPDFARASREAHRVLKPGGRFINYSRYAAPAIRVVYRILRKHLHTAGIMKGAFHLTFSNDNQRQIIEDIFGGRVTDRYTECLFHPGLKFMFTGKMGSRSGQLDSGLGNISWIGRWIARQRSFESIKK